MKKSRTIILAVLTVTAVVLATVSILAYAYGIGATTNTYPSSTSSGTNGYYPNGMMGDWSGMSSMMSGYSNPSSAVQTPTAAQSAILPIVGFVALIGAAATGISGGAYYITGFKIRISEHAPKSIDENSTQNVTTAYTSEHTLENAVKKFPQNMIAPYASVSKTLTSEERKVLDVLVSHDGKYLQKYMRTETGLSRLKIHRIVLRLAERGIVTMERRGNTNEVHLSSWLQNPNVPEQNSDQHMKNIGISI